MLHPVAQRRIFNARPTGELHPRQTTPHILRQELPPSALRQQRPPAFTPAFPSVHHLGAYGSSHLLTLTPRTSHIYEAPEATLTAQAIADGVLADASTGDLAEVSAQHFPSVHVAMTATVFALIEQAVASPKHANDCRGVWHDILHMSRACPVRVWQGGRLFRVIITGTGRKRLHTLKAISHPDETGRPCLTIMLPDED
jgi:hypothetical protein